ncbi:DUF2627 family protein [Bacillus suaedaesalsae]|uniref:DUF2627 family protein n=1 Tax=Bacillus suaedaesalsae TaxID=2810349 RepID=A0ABS2DIL1_9BACI|nr:DUF2627 family protein [Bacillus suaedaesalsae]MBM6617353.1 DUF2627 family protein [Bacillus suaedaesalsae]
MLRFIALILVLIPVGLAALGIKLIRDMSFGILQAPIPSLGLQLLLGVLSLGGGLYLIGSFIFYRDRKRNKIQKKFMPRK